MKCTRCGSYSVKLNGTRTMTSGQVKRRLKCTVCQHNFYSTPEIEDEQEVCAKSLSAKTPRKYVITACQNNTLINQEFLSALGTYCEHTGAELMIVPILYKQDEYPEIEFLVPEKYMGSFVRTRKQLHDEVFVMGSFNFIPTTVNPLAGLESISKGSSLIVPSPQLRMKFLAVSASRHPAMLISTGAISHPEYENSKIGEKAKFNHSYSAVVVEIDSDDDYHVRVLNSDSTGGFHDLDCYYTPSTHISGCTIDALITGDEHAIFASPSVEQATYLSETSIAKTLKPVHVVRHDLLDCYSISHHHRKDGILSVGKHLFGKNSIKDELDATIDYLNRTTSDFINVIVSSNHNDHLTRWLKEVDIRAEPWNALVYHELMYKVLNTLAPTDTGVSHDNPFELYSASKIKTTRFLTRDESFTVHGVELNAHGDAGVNGSRGSINQYSNLSQKYVIGHSHTPGIVFGAYQVGTSSHLKLEYSRGPSSWMNTHCIIHRNGKRQLINIINGKWRA